ncbi:MAG: hypothetical protein ACI4OO_04940 [Otoolea sp.]|nr:hypothetical protein [Clostridiaceae bacterium]MDD6075006.1 hypothetical protein [Clostridium sp.]MDY5483410.1 hypothetical protein [Clostridium sp.]
MKIAVLATEYLYEYLKDSIEKLDLECQTEIFIYYNYSHIVDLYRQLEDRFDGFITTGPGPAGSIKKRVPECKPLTYFPCTESNYYRAFFEMMYKYQDWNFEKGYFDFCDYLCPDQESSLIEYLKKGTFKEWLDKNNQYIDNLSPEEIQEMTPKKLEKHIRLWKSGKIKYSLSRMSPIMPQILAEGVNCIYIPFSIEDMRSGFQQLIQEILMLRLRNNLPAAIDILLPVSEHPEDPLRVFQERYETLERLIIAFNKKYLCDFIVHETHLGFRISTNHKTVERITGGMTTCMLKEYIEQQGGFTVYIGYGIGTDLAQAEAAAVDASRESRIALGRVSYLKDEKRVLMALSGEEAELSITNEISPYVREISDRSGLSTLTIQKLIAALRIIGTEEVTTQELSRILHITARSANRFVAALVKCNLARVLYSKQNNTKGRPSKVYQILLDVTEEVKGWDSSIS